MDSEPAISTNDQSNIHVDVLISTGEHSNIEPSPSTEAKEVHCDVCNKKFSTKANLKRHIRRHNGSMLECSECSKQFDTKYHLENHRKLSHTAFNYKCSKCPKLLKLLNPELDLRTMKTSILTALNIYVPNVVKDSTIRRILKDTNPCMREQNHTVVISVGQSLPILETKEGMYSAAV
ncbi:Hypothetical predicted protein [Mytilus galloprovincialis]|nr:Hypothetical predicted protein [Mytilus galloprovincialis]